MAPIHRRFYQSWRGPGAADQDSWSLVFELKARRLTVRHEWQTAGHDSFDEFEMAEFLQQPGSAQTALIEHLLEVAAVA